MKCEKIQELLSLYVRDEGSPEERRTVRSHLVKCQNCATLFSFLKESQETLARFPELEVSEDLLEKLYTIPSRKTRFKLSFDFLLRPSLQPVFAAATILLILVSFYVFHPDKKFIQKKIDRQIHLGYSQLEKLYAKAGSLTDNLSAYKDNVLISLQNINPLDENED